MIYQDFLRQNFKSFSLCDSTVFYQELVFILVREAACNTVVLQWPAEEEAISSVQEEIVVLIKFEQVEAGERNFFVSLFQAVRETDLQGGFLIFTSLNRENP